MVSADRIEKKNTGHSGMRTGMTTVKYQLRSLTKHYNQQLEVKLNLGMWMQGAGQSRHVPKFNFTLERPFSGQCRNAIESCAREVVGELDLTAEAEVNFLHALDLVEVNPELRL